jgi:hypothetical protein
MNLKSSIFFLVIPLFSISATDIRISGSNHAEYWVFIDEELDTLNYKEHFEEKCKVSVYYGDILLRGTFFIWTPSLSIQDNLNYLDYAVMYRKDPVHILYGTYYTTFGRGLVLNAFLDEDFRNDVSLYGLKTDIKYFDSHITLLAGKPRNIFFEQNTYVIKNDTTDQLRGINFETRLIPMTTVGARYVRVNRLTDITPKAFTELYGGSVDFGIGPFETYVEYARQWGSYPVIGGRLSGDGFLVTSSFSIPGLGLSFQYMDYDTIGCGGAGYRYNEPPTPIKSGISVNRGIDERGFGATLSATPLDFISGELDYNEIKTHDKTQGVSEQIVKLTSHVAYNLKLIGGVERLVKENIEPEVEKKTEVKPYLEATYNFGVFFTEARYEHNFIEDNVNKYYEQTASFSIGKPELFVLTLRYDRRSRVIEYVSNETAWPLAELSLDLTHRHNLRIRVGAEKGGLICSGGVCRFEEPFKGVKAVLTNIF